MWLKTRRVSSPVRPDASVGVGDDGAIVVVVVVLLASWKWEESGGSKEERMFVVFVCLWLIVVFDESLSHPLTLNLKEICTSYHVSPRHRQRQRHNASTTSTGSTTRMATTTVTKNEWVLEMYASRAIGKFFFLLLFFWFTKWLHI